MDKEELRNREMLAGVMRSLIGHADILSVLVLLEPADREIGFQHIAGLCGYVVSPSSMQAPEPGLPAGLASSVQTMEPPKPRSVPLPSQGARFVRIERFDRVDESERPDAEQQEAEPQELRDARVLRDDEFAAPRGPDAPMPPPRVPLMPWSRLDEFTRKALGRMNVSHRYDLPAIVDVVARGRVLRRLPLARRQGWAPRATLLVDRDQSLTPFWDDQTDFYLRLLRRRGSTGLQVYLFEHSSPEEGAWNLLGGAPVPGLIPFPERGSPVLLLGDCGYLNSSLPDRRRAWRTLGRGLRRHGCRTVALAPCPRDRWPHDAFDSWVMACWDRTERCPVIADQTPAGGYGPRSTKPADDSKVEYDFEAEIRARRAEMLLRLLSPAVRIESGLLREARLMLQNRAADVGTEADAWNHPKVAGRSNIAIALDSEWAARMRREGAACVDGARDETPAAIPDALASVLIKHHRGLSQLIAVEEALHLQEFAEASGCSQSLMDQLAPAMSLADLVKTLRDPRKQTPGRAAWTMRLVDRCSAEMRTENPWLGGLYWLAWDQMPPESRPRIVPEGLHDEARNVLPLRQETRWNLWLRGTAFEIHPVGNRPGSADAPQGLPLLEWSTRLNRIRIETPRPDFPGREVRVESLPRASSFPRIDLTFPAVLKNEWETWELATISRPSWAAAMGRDRYGLWADLQVNGAIQRMRWINPGTFIMGSPPDEPGRYGDEGPQHRVTLTRGYWLADSPCTQEFWMAVRRSEENPSEFQSPDRPVEQVSWDDCERFLEMLSQMAGGLWRLPLEAEWEYACRAGTETALYSGPIDIIGEHNAPALDSISWYGGNSGVDLENGYDSSGWKEKQYGHEKAGTHPVKGKQPNNWGLYDMIGNVWEWCADGKRDYDGTSQPNPKGTRGGARVIRGGSWISVARGFRSACRYWYSPEDRADSLGFRFALGQQEEARTEHGERSESRAEREPRPRRTP